MLTLDMEVSGWFLLTLNIVVSVEDSVDIEHGGVRGGLHWH